MASIFLAQIPQNIMGTIRCKERIREIEPCNNEDVKKQKFYAWVLLENVAKKLGFLPENLQFKKLENGKWVCNEFEFSISHSKNFVVVAIDKGKIGVDIQVDIDLNEENFAKKILTKNEYLSYNNLKEVEKHTFLLEKWTQKESVYKKYFTSILVKIKLLF